jgi:hypothetical protein
MSTGPAFWLNVVVGTAVLVGVALAYGVISRRGRREKKISAGVVVGLAAGGQWQQQRPLTGSRYGEGERRRSNAISHKRSLTTSLFSAMEVSVLAGSSMNSNMHKAKLIIRCC